MASNAPEPIEANPGQGIIDMLQAVARYAAVIITFAIALFGFLKQRDAVDAVAYVQANGGQLLAAVSGLIAIGTAAYGVYKSHKRGAQVADVAANPRVPPEVAHLK